MKTFPAGLSNLLATGTTTLCRCWRVERWDGAVFGFTDHDRVVGFSGVDYQPETGFTPSAVEASLGLAVDTQEVEGALSADAITETDIALGLWDNAAVTLTVVDWTNLSNRAVLRAGSLGEIARGGLAFTAEIRSLAHALNQAQGRTYQRLCDAVLGDARCGVDLGDPDFSGSGTVLAVDDGQLLTVAGIDGFAEDFFARGVLTWTTGDNAGAKAEIMRHAITDASDRVLSLWQRAALTVSPGDAFEVTAGCRKTFDVCREKFDNGLNFRGFPHIPGNDFALGVVKRSGPNDGGSFFNE